MQVEYVQWIDAHGEDGWLEPHTVNDDCSGLIHSVGFLFSENESSITLLFHASDDKKLVGNYITIPKVAVKTRKVLVNLDDLKAGHEIFVVCP